MSTEIQNSKTEELEIAMISENQIQYEILERQDGRFIICKKENEELLDDAQGYGYKTKKRAEKAAWYHFKGGKEKLEQLPLELRKIKKKKSESEVQQDIIYKLKKQITRLKKENNKLTKILTVYKIPLKIN